jgi:sec-independent protein translocase protein TatC
MTIREHLLELRSRIIRSALAVVVGAVVLLVFYDQVLEFLVKPYVDLCREKPDLECEGSLVVLGPLDGFATRVRIAGYGGIVLALPVVMWQIWRFVVPALEARERRYAVPFLASTLTLFAVGAWMAYWTLDKALEFLISWAGADVGQMYQVKEYVSLVTLMALGFGIGFLSPVLIVFLQLVGVVQPATLLRQWRVAIMVIFVAAAVITPSGDPVSLLALGLPMTILYVVAILIGWLVVRRRGTARGT